MLTGSGFTEQELYDKVEETLLPSYNNELRMNKKFVKDAGDAVYTWLSAQLLAFEHSETIRSSSAPVDVQVGGRAYAANAQLDAAPGQDGHFRGRGNRGGRGRGQGIHAGQQQVRPAME